MADLPRHGMGTVIRDALPAARARVRGTSHPAFRREGDALRFRTWSGRVSTRPRELHQPEALEELQEIVRSTAARGGRLRAVGAGHSFGPVAAGEDVMVNLDRMSGLIAVDPGSGRARLHAGTRLRDVPALLAPHSLALANQGDVNPQSLAGAISTSTHGTGLGFTGFAGTVTGLSLMGPDGEVRHVDPGHDGRIFDLSRVSLGLLGVLTEIELQCVPAFDLIAEEVVLTFDEVLDGLVERMRSADHFEFYWFPHTDSVLSKTNTRVPAGSAAPSRLAGARTRSPLLHLLDKELVENGALRLACELGAKAPALVPRINRLAQSVVSDRTYRAPGHDVFVTPRRVRFHEMEYALPLEQGPAAIREIRALIEDRGWRISFPLEVRAAAADGVPLSTASGRETMYVAVHRFFREDCTEYFGAVEEILRAHGGRPHWGKVHTLGSEELRALYPRFEDFCRLREELDPAGMFGSCWTDRLIGREPPTP